MRGHDDEGVAHRACSNPVARRCEDVSGVEEQDPGLCGLDHAGCLDAAGFPRHRGREECCGAAGQSEPVRFELLSADGVLIRVLEPQCAPAVGEGTRINRVAGTDRALQGLRCGKRVSSSRQTNRELALGGGTSDCTHNVRTALVTPRRSAHRSPRACSPARAHTEVPFWRAVGGGSVSVMSSRSVPRRGADHGSSMWSPSAALHTRQESEPAGGAGPDSIIAVPLARRTVSP